MHSANYHNSQSRLLHQEFFKNYNRINQRVLNFYQNSSRIPLPLLFRHYVLTFSETWTVFRTVGAKYVLLFKNFSDQSEFQSQKQLMLSNIFEYSRAFSCPVTCWLSALSWQSWNCRCELTAEQLLSNNKPPRNKTKKLNTCRKKCQIAPAKMDLSITFLILLCTPAIFCAETCGKDAEGKWFKLQTKAIKIGKSQKQNRKLFYHPKSERNICLILPYKS